MILQGGGGGHDTSYQKSEPPSECEQTRDVSQEECVCLCAQLTASTVGSG